MLRLGVMGGTFDPLHWAHLIMAEEARSEFSLDKVLFVPAARPPHKSHEVSDPEHRYAMALIGTAGNPHFEVSRMELLREGPSYSVDTIRALRESAEVYFILGADEALDLPEWYEAEALPRLARFVVAPRLGLSFPEVVEALPERFASALSPLPMSPVVLSATELRARVAAGQSIRYLVPEAVETYIRKHRLYLEGGDG
ncbi:MAG: nicotinate-nucleotide adenylyltransferase [Armatimonadota bacterium]